MGRARWTAGVRVVLTAVIAGWAAAPVHASAPDTLGGPVEPLVIRISDAWAEPGGQAAIVLRTYASLPVRRGKIRVGGGNPLAPLGSPLPIASWDSARLFDADGNVLDVALSSPGGDLVDLDFLDNASFVFNRSDGVVAVIYATVAADASPGDYPVLGDDDASELRDPEDDPVLMHIREGELRIRSAATPPEFEISTAEVQSGSAAEIEIGTGERFAIGSGTLVLLYDPDVLLPGAVPTVESDPRHGEVELDVDVSTAGRIEIQLESPDGSFNADVPGDLLIVNLPTRRGIPAGTERPVTVGAGTELLDPGGVPIDLLYESGGLEFVIDPDIFRDGFGIGDTGWWQVGP